MSGSVLSQIATVIKTKITIHNIAPMGSEEHILLQVRRK
jgi:hypothetical protein